MKKSTGTSQRNAMRYHLLGNDGLYTPIPFLFVTDRMSQEIIAERQQILAALSANQRERQLKLFERYDPQHSSAAFNAMLHLFSPTKK
ncbi:MAG: hypothetical protein KUL75_10170 [Sterolibacterium sp.]|nr:hypothetical protein [Sterolibacterium sp.]